MTENVFAKQIGEIANSFLTTTVESRYLSDEKKEQIEELLKNSVFQLLNDKVPKIMVYGIYNSGKSTLVNAICGKKVAEVADRPMTYKMGEYDTGKYILIDSPGVNAPIEHEKLADAHLKNCHIILFVISSKGMFEDKVNYQKMLDLINRKIPFYIVLNDRGAEIPADADPETKNRAKEYHREELNAIKRKIIDNLMKYSGDTSIGDKYDVIELNAKRAWTGIEKNKPALVAKSGVPELCARIESILESDGAFKRLLAPIATLEDAIGQAEKELYIQTGHSDYGKKKNNLDKMFAAFENELDHYIRLVCNNKTDKIYQGILSVHQSFNVQSIYDEVLSDIQNKVKQKITEIQNYFKENFDDAFRWPAQKNLHFSVHSPQFSINEDLDTDLKVENHSMPSLQFESSDVLDDPMDFSGLSASIGLPEDSLLDLIPVIGPIIKCLKIGGNLIFGNAKKYEEEARRLEAEVAKYNQEVEQRVSEAVRKRQEMRMYANTVVDDMSRTIRNFIRQQIDAQKTKIYEYLYSNEQALKNVEKEMYDTKVKLSQYRKQLSSIRNKIYE